MFSEVHAIGLDSLVKHGFEKTYRFNINNNLRVTRECLNFFSMWSPCGTHTLQLTSKMLTNKVGQPVLKRGPLKH